VKEMGWVKYEIYLIKCREWRLAVANKAVEC
jgi:hypothetical protein